MQKPIPSVHRSVHYFDREEIVNADQQQRRPEPFAAIITRVHRDEKGEPTGLASLAVFDPEIGYQVRHDVLQGENYDTPEANRWYFTPYQSSPKASPAGAEHPLPRVEELERRIAALEDIFTDAPASEGEVGAEPGDTTSERGGSRKKK